MFYEVWHSIIDEIDDGEVISETLPQREMVQSSSIEEAMKTVAHRVAREVVDSMCMNIGAIIDVWVSGPEKYVSKTFRLTLQDLEKEAGDSG